MIRKTPYLILFLFLTLAGCRKEEPAPRPTDTPVTEGDRDTDITGFYLLNEGNMGSNKATLDYFDYGTGTYHKNIYADRNPGVVRELGDVGNDLQIYGNRLYAVINCSHLVEVMDATTARHIGRVSIPNCRFITFHDRYAYVSSYAGPVQVDPHSRLGYVAKIDTASLQIVGTCTVGYQPEQLVIDGNKLYVANSGGYRAPDYDRRVSVIDLDTFRIIKEIEVGINLFGMVKGLDHEIYVSSRGNYQDIRSQTYLIDTRTDRVTASFPLLANSQMARGDGRLYVISHEYNALTGKYHTGYCIWNLAGRKVERRNFIQDGTENEITVPYGLAVHPKNGDLLITDAKDYLTPGRLYCYGADGIRKWSVTTGDIPAHIAFTTRKVQGF